MLQAIQHSPPYQDRPLRDGKSAADHVRAWTEYYRAYADQRAARGLLVECASSIYGKYSAPEIVNLADFADDALLRRKMTMLLDILWADWAVEQLGGVRGGGKSRVYQGKYSRFGDRDSYGQMASVLMGEGPWTDGVHGHTNSGFVYCLATTRYRLPQIVHRLIDAQQRGCYVYVSRRPAKMTAIEKLPEYVPHPCWYVLDPEDTRAVRYSYCTPDYVMGSWWVDPALAESVIVREGAGQVADYAALHAQNRWQGVIFAGDPNARLYPQCLTTRRTETDAAESVSNHQQIAVQHHNVMIAQANLARNDIEAMRVYLADGLRDRVVENRGWLISRGQCLDGLSRRRSGHRQGLPGTMATRKLLPLPRLADARGDRGRIGGAPQQPRSLHPISCRLAAWRRPVDADGADDRFAAAGRDAHV